MKKFYIQLPSENKDPKGLLKKYLVEKILGRSPWLSFAGIDTPSVNRGVQYAGPKDYIVFDPNAEFDVNWATYDDLAESTKAIPTYNLYDNFTAAIEKLEHYARAKHPFFSKPDYDFKYFGQPVKVFDNYVQIGYDIIPRNNVRFYLSSLPEKSINNITNVIVKINNYKFA